MVDCHAIIEAIPLRRHPDPPLCPRHIPQICSPMRFIVEGRRVPSHTKPTPGGTSATSSARWPVMGRAARAVSDGLLFARRRPARPPAHRRRRGPVAQRRHLTRIGPTRPHPVMRGGLPYTRPAPRHSLGPPAGRHTRQRCEKCAPDGVPSWVFAGRRKRPPVRGALLGLSGSTRPFTRGPRPLATPGQGWLGRRGGVGGMRL